MWLEDVEVESQSASSAAVSLTSLGGFWVDLGVSIRVFGGGQPDLFWSNPNDMDSVSIRVFGGGQPDPAGHCRAQCAESQSASSAAVSLTDWESPRASISVSIRVFGGGQPDHTLLQHSLQ